MNPRTGHVFDNGRYKKILVLALAKAGIEGVVRPSHDLRHSSITNSAIAGATPEALMSRAGHSSFATTRRYINSTGEEFREDADMLEARIFNSGTKSRYEVAAPAPSEETQESANR